MTSEGASQARQRRGADRAGDERLREEAMTSEGASQARQRRGADRAGDERLREEVRTSARDEPMTNPGGPA
jgi:hypothetical protein